MDRHSAVKSQVTATLETAKSQPVISVLGVVTCSMAASTRAQTDFRGSSVMERFRPETRLGSLV